MDIILSIFLVASLIPKYHNVNPGELYLRLFNPLIERSHIHDVDPRVHLELDTGEDDQGSQTDPSGTIHLSLSDVIFVNFNPNAVAFIIAHELGHNVLGHVRGNEYLPQLEEIDADMYAVRLTHITGFDSCVGARFFQDAINSGNEEIGYHSAFDIRIQYIMNACYSSNIPLPHLPVPTKFLF